jgi:hypothetical protein
MRRLPALLVLVACGGSAHRVRTPPPPAALAGEWAIADGSDIVVRVALGPPPVVEAWDGDGTRFEVTDVVVDGLRLRATFRYPPTGVVTMSDLELTARDRLEGTVSGAYSGRETWLRRE